MNCTLIKAWYTAVDVAVGKVPIKSGGWLSHVLPLAPMACLTSKLSEKESCHPNFQPGPMRITIVMDLLQGLWNSTSFSTLPLLGAL